MNRKTPTVLPLATALAALGGTLATAPAGAASTAAVQTPEATRQPGGRPNGFMTVGGDIMGFTVSQAADGTVLAQHSSHYSHSSHASHASHHSSRY